jgi:hypothetical protein
MARVSKYGGAFRPVKTDEARKMVELVIGQQVFPRP